LWKWCANEGPAPLKTRFQLQRCCIFAALQQHQQIRKMNRLNLTKLVQKALKKQCQKTKHNNRHKTNAYESDFDQTITKNSIMKRTGWTYASMSFWVPFSKLPQGCTRAP
jgi:hypothetical protein